MALIKCPECGKEVSNTAKACPNCGYELNQHQHQQPPQQFDYKQKSPLAKTRKKGCLPILILFVVLVVITALFKANNPNLNKSNNNSSSASTNLLNNAEYIDRIDVLAIEDGIVYYNAYITESFDWNGSTQTKKYDLSKYVISECEILLSDEQTANAMTVTGFLPNGNMAFSLLDNNIMKYYKDNFPDFELDLETGQKPNYYTEETVNEFHTKITEVLSGYNGNVTKVNFSTSDNTVTLYVSDAVKLLDSNSKKVLADNLAKDVSYYSDYYFHEYQFLDFRYSDGSSFAISSVWDKNLVNLK